jgi:hypothetical protein
MNTKKPSYNVLRPVRSIAAMVFAGGIALAACAGDTQQTAYHLYCGDGPAATQLETARELSVEVDDDGSRVVVQEVLSFDHEGNPKKLGAGLGVERVDGGYAISDANGVMLEDNVSYADLRDLSPPTINAADGAIFGVTASHGEVHIAGACSLEELRHSAA